MINLCLQLDQVLYLLNHFHITFNKLVITKLVSAGGKHLLEREQGNKLAVHYLKAWHS